MIARRLATWAPAALGVPGAVLALRYAAAPYLWIAAIGTVLAAWTFTRSRGALRVVAFNAGAVCLILGAAEAWCWRTTPAARLRTEVSPRYVTSHAFLGNAPYPGIETTVSRFDRDRLLYRVRYAIDSLGWRVTPPAGEAAADASPVACFGCSMTFGEGVADTATLPAQIERVSGGRFRGVNFGFSGYGPQQMLAILEHRLEAAALPRPPALAVYLAIPDHVARALGRTSWDPGPRYRLGDDGRASFAGRYRSPLAARLRDLLDRSFLVRRVRGIAQGRVSDADLALYFAIVERARDTFRERYPGAGFVVIYWDSRERTPRAEAMDRRIVAGFTARGIHTVTASELLPGYPGEAARYLLSADDPHPNALAYRTLARALLERLLDPSRAVPSPPIP